MIQLSLVVPLYNEEKRVRLLEEGLRRFLESCSSLKIEVLLVNDGSRDNTLSLLDRAASELGTQFGVPIRTINLHHNVGKGGALQAGIAEAKGQWILTLDADMATDPTEVLTWQKQGIFNLEVPVRQKRVFLGSREHADSIVVDKPYRRVMGRVFNLIAQIVNSLYLRDTQCGFKLYPATAAKKAFANLKDLGWAHDVEILSRLKDEGYEIIECPIHWQAVDDSRVNPIKDSIRMFAALLKIRLSLAFEKLDLMPWLKRSDRSKWGHFSAILFALALGIVLFTFGDYGMTWDEPVQAAYGRHVVDYYWSFFRDVTALNFHNLYLYGGFFDSLTSIVVDKLASWLPKYETRHLFNALYGLVGIFGTWKLTNYLAGPRAGFLAALLLILCPVYYGHMFNNPKDIPFATGYIWSLYYMVASFKYLPHVPRGLAVKLGTAIGLTLAVRIGGLLLLCYLGLAYGCYFMTRISASSRRSSTIGQTLRTLAGSYGLVFLTSYSVMLFFWPWAQRGPLVRPLMALKEANNFAWHGTVLFKGQGLFSTELPSSYLAHLFSIQLPELFLLALSLSAIFLIVRLLKARDEILTSEALLWFSAVFPIAYATLTKAVLYDNMRHFLFVIPPLAVVGGLTLNRVVTVVSPQRIASRLVWGILGIYALYLTVVMVQYHPYQYTYFNRTVGGLEGASGRYELDYWGTSYKEAASYLNETFATANGPVKVFACPPQYNLQYFLDKEKFSLVENREEANVLVGLNRGPCFREIEGNERFVINRFGAPLTVVKEGQPLLNVSVKKK